MYSKLYSPNLMKTPALLFTSLFALFTLLYPTENAFAQCPENAAALTPAPLEEPWAIEWWMPRHLDKLQEEGRDEAEILLIGDSITHGWELRGAQAWNEHFGDFRTFNIGYSGDRTENVLWRLQNGEVEGISPKLALLMIGTNNTGHRMDPADCTAAGIGLIISELRNRLPQTHFLLLAIFPRGEQPDDGMRVRNEEINRLIAPLDELDRVTFLDLNSIFLTDEGILTEEIMPDLLHPHETGYRLWAEALRPVILGFFN
ncbi:MAG: acetylglucosamine-6-sulfatase [Balneolaceae bacterium]|nr:MAG: acetylglucosamine-6-sulfatase [Balneolaceae bacterium]